MEKEIANNNRKKPRVEMDFWQPLLGQGCFSMPMYLVCEAYVSSYPKNWIMDVENIHDQ